MRIFACLKVDRSNHSGSEDKIAVSLLGQGAELASVDMQSPGKPGDTFVHLATGVPRFPQAAVEMVTLGVRGDDLLRITDAVVWSTTEAADGPHPLVVVPFGNGVESEPVSADPAEGRLFLALRRVETAPATARIAEIVVVSECWPGHENGAVLELALRRADQSLIEALPLIGSDRLRPGEAGIWRQRLATAVSVGAIGSIALRNVGATLGAVRIVSVFGREFRRSGLPRALGLASSGDRVTGNSGVEIQPGSEFLLRSFAG